MNNITNIRDVTEPIIRPTIVLILSVLTDENILQFVSLLKQVIGMLSLKCQMIEK
jgi:hypothetical protein